MEHQNHKVLIVEDRGEIAARLSEAVAQTNGLTMAGVASTVERGLDLLFELKPRIVLVDLGLPDGSGVDVIRAIANSEDNAPSWECDALVISIFGDEARVVQAIQAGARGYVLKSGGLKHIGEDVFAVIEGSSPISPAIARHLLTMLKHQVNADVDVDTQLTNREAEILQAVARGYKRKEIGEAMGISTGTVGNHIHKIYRKLNVGSNTEAIAQASKMGLL